MDSDIPAPLQSEDTLRAILEKLPVPDLARAACVCRLWNTVASDREMRIREFKALWKLKNIIGNPSSGTFWKDSSISKFAISHPIVRSDSVASLAVKYSVHVMDIKRLNNMISDHGIYSRERLLIPISNRDLLVDGTCYVELDSYAKREVAVLYLEGHPNGRPKHMSRELAASGHGERMVIDSLRRSMQVDDGTAQYYLAVSNGDPRTAIAQFSDDLRWERQVRLA